MRILQKSFRATSQLRGDKDIGCQREECKQGEIIIRSHILTPFESLRSPPDGTTDLNLGQGLYVKITWTTL